MVGAEAEASMPIASFATEVIGGALMQHVGHVAERVPIVGAVAVLISELVNICDACRCHEEAFQTLKRRMKRMYGICYGERGKHAENI